ncbi:DEAD/DEAH box helicase [Romboutsia lituseburensis]|uniref:DEAD/DEAH box helicase n=1 Tax=Romboutsia lituseburensis TaxID=1537 RepID=UPI00215B6A87|nr:DEAD/DEAH box helicase [Romboutsia lituseburensis]MCR8743777.1 DEAD/DEAH box helicase [Romboutsia lituseburensis]
MSKENNTFREFNLDKEILKALNNLEYKIPSDVQIKTIPQLINKKDVIVKSKTGSGKTASFAIPICENINIEDNNVQALVIVPTRELALQVKEEISNIGRLKKVRCCAIFGKQSIKEQISSLKQRVHVVVATPGRIIDHIKRETINIKNLKYLIIDEADKMLNKGFIEQIDTIFENLPKQKTVGLFSATIDKEIEYVCEKYMKDALIIAVEEAEAINKKQIDENLIKVDENEKYNTLKDIIYSENPKTVIIFANTREKVNKIYNQMKRDKFLVRELHGDMSQDKRIYVIKDFKENKFNILVSSDVAARGIHIENISLVINYDIPRDKENYIHRIGRTGRKDKFGKSISIVTTKDEKYINEIQDYIGYEIKEIKKIDENDIVNGKLNFENSQIKILKNKRNKDINKKSHSEVTRIYLNAGKKKKIRVLDIVGAISNLKGISVDDIGVIEVSDLCSYVDILNHKGEQLLKNYKQINIKKKLVKIKRDNQNV